VTLNDLSVDRSAGIIIQGNVNVEGTLTMTDGDIITNADTLTLGASSATLGSLNWTAGSVVGNFRRWFATSTVSNVLFPVGSSSYDDPAVLSFTTAPSVGGTLTATFKGWNPGDATVPFSDGSVTVRNVSRDGFWTISHGDALAGGIYSLDLTLGGFGGITDYATLRLIKRADSTYNWQGQGSHSAGTGSNALPVIHRTGMSGFSDFGVGSQGDNTLPVEMLSFNGILRDDRVELQWTTASEVNNQGFYIERHIPSVSSDAGEWKAVGFQAGHGTTGQPHGYSFSDEIASLRSDAPASVEYRLRQVDYDGSTHYTNVVQVMLSPLGTYTKLRQNYPNPFSGMTTISYTVAGSGKVLLELYDVQGVNVRTLVDGAEESGEHNVNLSRAELQPGVYYCRLSTGSYVSIKRMVVTPE
jgi:hypothetical protein